MTYNRYFFRFLFFLSFAIVFQSCVEDDDFDVPEDLPVEEVEEIITLGGDDISYLTCLNEGFESYNVDFSTFPQYENLTTLGTRTWSVNEFDNNFYLRLSAFGAQSYIYSYFVIPVNFDEADSFSFTTQDRFWNGDPLRVFLVSDYTVDENITQATFEDITSSFEYSSGNTEGGTSDIGWTDSGSFDLSNYQGNGFIAFKYEGDGQGITTTMHIDDITIVDNENQSCQVLEEGVCDAEDFENYSVDTSVIPGSQIVTTQGEGNWRVREFGGNNHLFMSSFQSGEVQSTWFIQGVNFDVAEEMSFETLSGFYNADVLSVWTSTDYDFEAGNPTTATWTEITDQFAISANEDGFANSWTESGKYAFSGLSGQGFVAFVYNGDDTDGSATTAMQIDNIQYFSTATSGECTYPISDDTGGGNGGNIGGENATPESCLSEDFESFANDQIEFSNYESISDDEGRYWEINEFNNNKYLRLSAFAGSGNSPATFNSYFVVSVNFDQADTFRFKTQDRFHNGNPLKVYTSTDYMIGSDINQATLTDITSSFTIAEGTPGSDTEPFVNSGDFDLSGLSGNGFIIFEYDADGSVSTTMHIDDIEIIDNEDSNCGGTVTPCATEDFEAFADQEIELATYQNISEVGDEVWQVRTFDDNQYIQMSAFESTGPQTAWFIMGANFDNATGISFETKDGFNNGDALTIWYSTNYDEQGDPTTADWTDITSEFTLASGTSSGFADNFTPSGTYEFMNLSGNGYIAFKYDGAGDGVTTTFQVDNINLYGEGTCTFDLPAVDDGGGSDQMHIGGQDATPLACAFEDFESFAENTTEFPQYEGIALTGDLFWEVREFGGNQYAQFSAFNNAEHDVMMLVNVDFDQADTFSFKTKDGFNNGDALSVWYTTSHMVGEDVDLSEWTDITSEFTLASGSTGGFADEFTESGDFSLNNITGSGFIAFRYQGNNDGGVTTTFQVDDITITDAEDADCNNGGGGETADLIISEIADPNDIANARFIEIYNPGTEAVDLTGWQVLLYYNSNTDVGATNNLEGSIAAGDTFVLADNETEFTNAYGFAPDQDGTVNSNGDDNFELVDPNGNVVDIFGLPGEDGTGTDHEFENGRVYRNADVMTPNTTYTASEWTITLDVNTTDDAFTPGTHPDTTGGGEYSDLIISEYAEGSSNNKYLEIYNGTGADVDLSNYKIWRVSNGGVWPEAETELSGMLANGATYVIANSSADQTILDAADITDGIVSWNGDDAVGLVKNDTLIDSVGTDGEDPGNGWDVAGVEDGTQNHTLVRKSTITDPNTDWAASAGTNADDSEWVVLDNDDWSSIGQR